MLIDVQKIIADQILEKVELIDPYCFLAGGAPRDWHLGREARDLDIYFHVVPEYTNKSLRKALSTLLGVTVTSFKRTHDKSEAMYSHMTGIRGIFETQYENMEVQLIRMDHDVRNGTISDFGSSICKVFYKDGLLHPTGHFVNSIKSQSVVYKPGVLPSQLHAKKMREYFPDYEHFFF